MASIDLNADLGEEAGSDADLLAIVTSANVAAGGHAGGGEVLHRTVREAMRHGVAVGAHPSYPDRAGFGRVSRATHYDGPALRQLLVEQILVVRAACADAGSSMTHVKAHGALYADVADLPPVAEALVAAVREVAGDDGAIPVLGMSGTVLERACREGGVLFVGEAFADRAYAPSGRLVPRSEGGAVLHDVGHVAEQVRRLATEGTVIATDGSPVALQVESLCVHGDTPGAVAIARTVRRVLEEEGVTVAPWSPS